MHLKESYTKEIVPKLMRQLSVANVHAVPRLEKAVLNVGLSKGLKDAAYIDAAESTLTRITGQKPVRTKAKKSISNFKIRQGMVIGMQVTLRGARMYDFLEKLIKITLPRVRDFRGISPAHVDKNGNLNIGIREHLAFPEIRADEIERIHGLEVALVTNAGDRAHGLALWEAFGIPFAKETARNT